MVWKHLGKKYSSKSYLIGFENCFGIRDVQVSFCYGQRVVPSEVFHELRWHSRLQHFGDSCVFKGVEMVGVRHRQLLPHSLPNGEHVLCGVEALSGREIRGENVII